MTAPLVSVVIDTYNHERYIEEAIVSALEQDFPVGDREILVVDDGSTDRTAEIVRKFEPEVRLVQKANGGQASAINSGVAHARGELIAFLDGDDRWLPGKLSRVVKEFEREPRPVLVYHKYVFWDSKENRTWDPDYFAEVSGDVPSDRRKLLRYVAAPTSSLVFRREALERLMPVPEECSFMWDSYAVSGVIFLGPVAAIGECLTGNRIHGQNLWFAEGERPSAEVLRDRVKTRQAAIEAIRSWVLVNGRPSWRSKAQVLLRRWELVRDGDEFRLKAPGRFRSFRYHARYNLTYRPMMTRSHLAYMWVYACAVLVLGPEHSHYLEGVRTRVKRLTRYFERRPRPEARSSRPI